VLKLPWLSLAKKSETFDGLSTKSVDRLLDLTDLFLLDRVRFCNTWRTKREKMRKGKKREKVRKERK
jgi:hypothetical protein